MKIAIVTDSSCTLTEQQLRDNHVYVLPFKITLGETVYTDCVDITKEDMYAYVENTKTLPKTSAINVVEYEDYFQEILKDHDSLIYISISSEISSTYNNARLASANFEDGKVYLVDSKSLSCGQGLLALACAEKIKENKPASQIAEELTLLAEKLQTSFIINRLDYLHKGGRCSSIQLLGANLLKIKPKIELIEGKMGMAKKYMGKYSDAVKKYATETLSEHEPDLENLFIAYTSEMPVVDELETLAKEYGFKNVNKCFASSTIAAHCGPETVGFIYLKK